MVKKAFAILLTVIVGNSTFAYETKKDTLPAYIGISYIPGLNWKVKFVDEKTLGRPLKLNFDLSSMTTYEGNFGIRKIGIRMGLSAQMENNIIGKVYQWGGYLGYKNMMLRLQTSKISGNLKWEGALPPGFYATRDFSNKYFNIDLLRFFIKKRYIDGEWKVMPEENLLGFYWGIGYTSMGYPVQLATLITEGGRENQKFGITAYDTLYKVKSYNIQGGFDILRYLYTTGGRYGMIPGRPAMKFGVYASTQDKVGFGTGRISNYGVKMAETLNPGKTAVTSSFFNVMVHLSISIGFRYYFRTGPAAYVFAIGYDLEGAAITPFGGAADTSKDLGFDINNYYFNHGVSFKLFIAFDKDWK